MFYRQAPVSAHRMRGDERPVLRQVLPWQSLSSAAEIDPDVWSGRVVQEVFVDAGDAVLHQCIRPLIGACAPGPHGYQRACDLISGQASNGPNGSPVFARAGKTDPPSSSHPLADLGG
jgi:hypothetical protein